MAIKLKLATDDTPEPWQAAEAVDVSGAALAPLDYAREGLPSAPPKSMLRTLLAAGKVMLRAAGLIIGGALLVMAMALLAAATVARFILQGAARLLLWVRRASPARLYQRMRWGRVAEAELA